MEEHSTDPRARVVTLSMDQIGQAAADYCVAHGLVAPGTYQIDIATMKSGDRVDHMRLTFNVIQGAR